MKRLIAHLVGDEYASQQGLRSIDLERFYAKIDRSDIDGCWPWMGQKSADGYGRWEVLPRAEFPRRIYRASRLALSLEEGDLGDLWSLHKCANPSCCRYDEAHVYSGNAAQNTADTFAEGNHWMQRPELLQRGDNHHTRRHPENMPRGEAHGNVTKNDLIVAEVRERYAIGLTSQYALASEYGVSQPTISTWVRNVVRKPQ